jgi:hypothetical protein
MAMNRLSFTEEIFDQVARRYRVPDQNRAVSGDSVWAG